MQRHNLEVAQAAFYACRVSFVPRALKDFEQNVIADQDRLATNRCFELGCACCPRPTQMGDPHRAVDEDHDPARRLVAAHLVEVALPAYSPERFERLGLLADLNQQLEALFHHRTFGWEARQPHNPSHQSIVDLNVGPHRDPSRGVYQLAQSYTEATRGESWFRTGAIDGRRARSLFAGDGRGLAESALYDETGVIGQATQTSPCGAGRAFVTAPARTSRNAGPRP